MHTPPSVTYGKVRPPTGLSLSAFLLALIAMTFLAVIRASLVLLCTNMADAIWQVPGLKQGPAEQ